MHKHLPLVFATLALSTAAFAQTSLFSNDGIYQIGYAANLNIGDSVLNLTNDGFNGGFFGAQFLPGTSYPGVATQGNMCANVYTFDATEEEISCCSCLVTPNGLNSLSVKGDLISNTLTPAVPSSVVIKILGSEPTLSPTGTLSVCDPTKAGLTSPTALAFGIVAWGSTLEPSGSPNTYNAVNVPYATGQLAWLAHGGFVKLDDILPVGVALHPGIDVGSELWSLTSTCQFLQANGSGFGTCRTCRTGALSGSKN